MDITPKQLKEKLDRGDDFVLIDVREPNEHEAFNVGGQLIPVNTIPARISDLEDKKDAEIVVYCRSGARSGMAQRFMQGNGFTNVRNLTGGMLAWQDEFEG
ncbi:rhodanese-like domain-containing protein [Flavilitoribacter nigricans]|uniref:NADH oxidase n=1 Tax=Flavilitoribacter nigricans (strain ATCC 23147 / DSM 23189 / NBRC 102662 / NCIMB 1420 / SS-2) TaxID=1122177 RepID=A0A2D0NA31_FLAN2|nr:rhodanese-like domain-containing protein [Flavilitoribacter nigricans]PHN05337.1 NADH oxidase [Flavilitoribacter nigricans DSM 23189 = NBRC 102662]